MGRSCLRLSKGKVVSTFFICCILSIAHVTPVKALDRDTSWYREFVDAIGETLYTFAWPTATYKRVSFEGVSRVYGGANIKIKLHGISNWDDSSLWTEVILEVRDGELKDLKWGRNNAILAQPGESMRALGQALVELNNEYQRSQNANNNYRPPSSRSNNTSSAFGFKITNSCRYKVRLFMHYRNLSDAWITDGSWTISGNTSTYLANSNNIRLKTTTATAYYYAELLDQSYEWAGDHKYSFGGRVLAMRKIVDKDGDTDWFISCPGK